MMSLPIAGSIGRALETKQLPFKITGTVSPTAMAWILAQTPQEEWQARPRVVITENDKSLDAFVETFKAFRPKARLNILRAFDETPYSGLYPSSLVLHERTQFFWRAHQYATLRIPEPEVFVATIGGLLQKTAPLDQFFNYAIQVKKNEEIDLQLLSQQLGECGYQPAPLVEDCGTFAKRGGIIDVFSPAHGLPLRIELFGDQIESLRLFDPDSQRTEQELETAYIIPPREVFLTAETLSAASEKIAEASQKLGLPRSVREELNSNLRQKIFFHGIDYLLPFFYDRLSSPLDAFQASPLLFWLDELAIIRAADGFAEEMREGFHQASKARQLSPPPESFYTPFSLFRDKNASRSIELSAVHITDVNQGGALEAEDAGTARMRGLELTDLSAAVQRAREAQKDFFLEAADFFRKWQDEGLGIYIFAGTQTLAQRIQYLCENNDLPALLAAPDSADWDQWAGGKIGVIPRSLERGLRLPDDHVVFVTDEDLFGSKQHRPKTQRSKGTLEQRTNTLSFGDLSPGDLVVHAMHGISVYEGLKTMMVQNVENEFIQLRFKDGDKLYLPVYRVSQIQKYSTPGGTAPLDKLGGTSWQRAKVKVRSALKDVASELLDLYAKRQSAPGFAFSPPDMSFQEFEATFPYDETPDQEKAIHDVLEDMQKARPMDRLVCGDVGFGKTEVAIRAAYKAAQDGKQVAVLVPTTVLAFQHATTFSKRFKDTAVRIAALSRFTPTAQSKKDLAGLAEGKIDVIIGTHRLLSKDVAFKDLGLLVIDEEQKFGVTHKEKIKRFRSQVDVLALSATPIPRTLNMSLMGIRDLSIINTPPENRLSIRTFVCRFDEDVIRKAVTSEIQRGGQIFFIHNRVTSIHGLADQIRQIVPDARLRIAHGQMAEGELEKTMLDFYAHEFDVLLCTTIIESGLDVPNANTIIVDRADTFGLSQLYQLRGRVGRSKDRAYAYLLLPETGVIDKTAQERLKILQEYTELGSGFHIAHHDLELRGSGNILGEDQSGHISAVGYELYMELLEQALSEAKGEPQEEMVEPEINLRIPALIPDGYIDDIRIRLSYYKALSQIEDEADLDRIEEELVDRFGAVPEVVTNLFGIMLIRKICRDLGVRDISAGTKNVSIAFTPSTKAQPQKLVELATRLNTKYQLTPDSRLIIRVNSSSWAAILEELKLVKSRLL